VARALRFNIGCLIPSLPGGAGGRGGQSLKLGCSWPGMIQLSRAALSMIAVVLVAVALGSVFVGLKLGVRYQINQECCQIPLSRSLVVSAKEFLGLATFYSQMGQDKWVSEAVFPGVKNGFFLDVGSGDGTIMSNTKALEQKGWTGICIDPFPRNMQDRSCQIFKEVVFSKAGERVKFWAHPTGFGVGS